MSHAVFIQNPVSPYKDQPGEAYHFPRRYLGVVQETIGDWVVFYEGRSGALGYVAVQRVREVIPDPDLADHFFAVLDLKTLWEFETLVPRADSTGLAFETSLRGANGRPASGGANVSAVRRLTPAEFAAIVSYGLRPEEGPDALPRAGRDDGEDGNLAGFSESHSPFDPAPFRREILTSRPAREAAFARCVKRAYRSRCAMSGLDLRNGGGRPEVEAAHIRPVAHGGPDWVRNGLALSGTLHWMFDRGLLSVADDLTILVSHNKVSLETVERLIAPTGVLDLPENPRDWPHPAFLAYHREHIFGQGA